MPRDNLTITAPDPQHDREEMFDLIAKVFSHRGYFAFRDYARDLYIGAGHYDWAASRIGRLDGRIVCHIGVWNYQMRIGRATVRTGGVGVVATHGDYRGRGLMSRMFPPLLDGLRLDGYDVSMLRGIRGFYDRFGYVSAWPDVRYDMQAGDLPGGGAPRLRAFSPGPREDLDRLYNRQHAALTGTAVRPTYRKNRRGKALQGRLWHDAGGRAAGYVLIKRKPDRLVCTEAVGNAEQTLAVLGALVRRDKVPTLSIERLPGRHPLARLLRQRTCSVTKDYCHNGRAMACLVNLPSALTRIAPELSRRLRASSLADWRGDLLLTAGAAGRAVLHIDRAAVTAAPAGKKRYRHALRGGPGTARLLLGSDAPAQVLATAGIRAAGNGRALAEALFPAQEPGMWAWDWF